MDTVSEGDVHTYEREFTTDEVHTFGGISGDQQPRHREPNDDGELMVQGLLTATIPTNIGAELGVMGQELRFEFHRPVYTGDVILCTWTNEEVTESDDRYHLRASVVCQNDANERVMTAMIRGVVWKNERVAE